MAISRYAVKNELVLEAEFRDEGLSGKTELEGRAGLSACLAYVREHKVDTVLVEDSTRLARDLIVAEVVIREFQRVGVRVISASGGVDLTAGDDTNPTAKLIRQILAAVAEFDRCCITMRTRAARDRIRKETGRCEGRPLYGTKPGEAETLALMQSWRRDGMTYQVIAAELNARGIKTRAGGDWRFNTIGKILAR